MNIVTMITNISNHDLVSQSRTYFLTLRQIPILNDIGFISTLKHPVFSVDNVDIKICPEHRSGKWLKLLL